MPTSFLRFILTTSPLLAFGFSTLRISVPNKGCAASTSSVLHDKVNANLLEGVEEKLINGDDISDSIDRAPCFDGICDSEPVDSKEDISSIGDNGSASTAELSGNAGGAILRLGTMTGPTVWSEFGRISQEHDVANLGQGFPDWLPPQFAVDSLVSATIDSTKSPHQYTRTAGHPNLVKQLARRYSKHMQKIIDPMNEIAVTVGASQALYLSLQTLVKPGDEVILFEPFFDLYVNQIKLAGGIPVYVPLTFVPYNTQNGSASGGEWVLEPGKLEEAVSSKTRAIILNSPHNPTGKVFTLTEMNMIADSKTFSATGWQVGWCVGPNHLISPIHQLLPYVQFCASTVIQEALARTLPLADEPYEGFSTYYEYLNTKYRRKRDLLGNALKDAGFAIPDYELTPGGGFFIFARITPELINVIPPERMEGSYAKNPAAPGGMARLDWTLCQWMAEEKGVLCIPSSPFFSREKALMGASDEFIRVAFCKTDETIIRAADALNGLKS
eukprot:scaffold4066_cov63-Cyclotella_meneghiniana.AAC.2